MSRKSAILSSFIGLSFALPLLASEGTLTLDFGGNTDDTLGALSVGGDGRLYALVSAEDSQRNFVCGVFALDGAGTLINAFGTEGKFQPEGCAPLLHRADNSFVLGAYRAGAFRLDVYDSAASLISSTAPVVLQKGEGVFSIAQQPDGKWLVGGGITFLIDRWTLRRWNADGSVDSTFSGGFVVTDPGGRADGGTHVRHIVPLADGKFLTSSILDPETLPIIGPGGNDNTVVLGRWNADGTRDFAFGVNGEVDLGTGSGDLVLDASGSIYVLAGGPRTVVRVTGNGTIDTSYGAQVQSFTSAAIRSLVLDSAERAVVFGDGFIARFTGTGAPDASFGGTGEVAVPLPFAIPFVVDEPCLGVLQPGDKPVLACQVPTQAEPGSSFVPHDLAITRYNVDGTLDEQFAANQPDSDVFPDVFTFDPATAPYGTAYVQSNPITITGINSKTSISAFSGYSIGCDGNFTTKPGTVMPGQTVCIRHSASTAPGGVSEGMLQVGERTAVFTITSTNEPADFVPDSYSFKDQTDVPGNSEVISESVQISGITGFAVVTIQGGQYSIGCTAAFTAAQGEISNGQSICVRHTSASDPGASVATTLSVGGVRDTFTSTTAATASTPPDPPSATPPPSSPAPLPAAQTSGGGGSMDIVALASLLIALMLTAGVQFGPRRSLRARHLPALRF